MIIKICGIRTVALAEQTARLMPDMIGFVFAKSRRQVAPAEAGSMIAAIRSVAGSAIRTAGVFVNPTIEELKRTLAEAPLDMIQLHGDESPDYCRAIRDAFDGIEVYKVFAIDSDQQPAQRRDQLDMYRGSIDGMLLDKPGGGTGMPFPWEAIPDYADWADEAGIPTLIAGGLNPDNVGELIAAYAPRGVDVSSGVETGGEKDIQLIRAFIERVRSIA